MLPCFPYGCAHTYSWAWSFLCFLPALRPPSGSWFTGSSDFSSPLGFPTFAMGSPLRGRGSFVLDRNEGLVIHLGLVPWSVPGWTSHLCLRVSARPVPQGVLPGGPRCVHELRLSLALSSVLYCPLLGFSITSPALDRGLGLSLVPYPLFCRLGLVPRSVAQLCALQPLVPSFRVCLSEAAGFGGFLVLSIVLP